MNTNRKSWPVSAYVVIASLALSFAAALQLVYSQTRESYRAVGFHDGQIDQSEQVVQSIRRVVKVRDCNEYKEKEMTKVVSVKTISIYAVAASDGSANFCQWY